MGGQARLDRQRERGRLNARERLAALFDPGTFFEIGAPGRHHGAAARFPGTRFVAGSGRIDGRPALAGAERRNGPGRIHRQRRLGQALPPLPARPAGAGAAGDDAGGSRPPGHQPGVGTSARGPDGPGRAVRPPSPMLCLVLGASAGPRGPHRPVVRLRGDDGDGLDLRGRAAPGEVGHRRGSDQGGTGADPRSPRPGRAWCTNVVADDVEAIAPGPGATSATSRSTRGSRRLGGAVPMRAPGGWRSCWRSSRPTLAVRIPSAPVLEALADDGELLEVQPGFGRSIVTALARLGGRSVAIVANDPSVMAGGHRQQRRRQGRPLPRGGRRLRAALRLPGRQSRGAGRHPRRAGGHPAPRGPHVSPCSTACRCPSCT